MTFRLILSSIQPYHSLQLQPKLLPQSTLGQAVNYFLNDYDALLGYLQDGRFEIDNKLVENDIRPTVVGTQAMAVHRPSPSGMAQRCDLLDADQRAASRP